MKWQFLGKSQCFYGSPYGIKEHKNEEMFLSTIILKHATPIRNVLCIYLDTFDFLMQQFCITAFKYGGLYSTFYDRCSTQYFVENSHPMCAKNKTTDILRCKPWTQSKHVKIYDNLRISLNETLFSIKTGARPLFFILIRPVSWHFCE